MRRSSALLVALLLVACTATVPVSTGTESPPVQSNPLIVPLNDTANYVTIPGDEVTRAKTTTGGVSFGTALAGDTATLRSDLSRITFEQSFAQANTNSERTAVIRSIADRVDRRKQALQRRDRIATRAFANGSMSAAEFTRERARIQAEASALQSAIERVEERALTDDRYSLSTPLRARLLNLAGALEVLQGPVSSHVKSAAAGESAGQSVYVEAGPHGYTMAYVVRDAYVRETYLANQHRPNATDQFDERDVPRNNAARLRFDELYPWVPNNSVSPTTRGLGTSGIYRITADFTNGELTAYIDGATTNVFRESQRHKLAAMPISNTVTQTNNSLSMRVNRTYETGPLQVSLARNDTGVPINSTVTVDGEPVGHTGDDGTLWIVEPRGPDQIEATTSGNESVSVSLPS